MIARNYRTSEAVLISSAPLFITNVTCQTFIAHAAARVGWCAYEPSCLTVDANVSHRKLATVVTVRINGSFAPPVPLNWSESDSAQPLPKMTLWRPPAVSATGLYKYYAIGSEPRISRYSEQLNKINCMEFLSISDRMRKTMLTMGNIMG